MSLKKLYRRYGWCLRSLPQTIYFNFHYLPFRQAIRLPVLLYKPHFRRLDGQVSIEGPVRTGMVRLGTNDVGIYPNSGIALEIGGRLTFRGRCTIGNDSYLSIADTGSVTLGDNFMATAALKLVCCCRMTFGRDVLCGWECMFLDTDYHKTKHTDGSAGVRPFGPIEIGDECWFALRSTVLKNTVLPPCTIVASHSMTSGPYDIPGASMIAGSPARLVRTGVYRDKDDDTIDYDA